MDHQRRATWLSAAGSRLAWLLDALLVVVVAVFLAGVWAGNAGRSETRQPSDASAQARRRRATVRGPRVGVPQPRRDVGRTVALVAEGPRRGQGGRDATR